jgi:hypothetical protein
MTASIPAFAFGMMIAAYLAVIVMRVWFHFLSWAVKWTLIVVLVALVAAMHGAKPAAFDPVQAEANTFPEHCVIYNRWPYGIRRDGADWWLFYHQEPIAGFYDYGEARRVLYQACLGRE